MNRERVGSSRNRCHGSVGQLFVQLGCLQHLLDLDPIEKLLLFFVIMEYFINTKFCGLVDEVIPNL